MSITAAISIISCSVYDDTALIRLIFADEAGCRVATVFRNSMQIKMYSCRDFFDGTMLTLSMRIQPYWVAGSDGCFHRQ